MTLGEFIEAWLADNAMTQRQLAARTPALNQVDISRMAGGQRPTVEKLRALAEAMGIPYNRLAVLAGYIDALPPTQTDAVEQDLYDLAKGRPDQIEKIRRFRDATDQETYEYFLRIVRDLYHNSVESAIDLAERLARQPADSH